MEIKCKHWWGKWNEVKDAKGVRYTKKCLYCGRKYTRPRPTVQAIHDVLVAEFGILPK
ncbi:MAG: hypothetical protein QME57_02920 [Patescibacteria group bacterium]|nr:hypothetical protein [Patescibacteria group bacterium]